MANLNRDYLISINIKEGNLETPKMIFYNTDKATSNMFIKLVINMSVNENIKDYVTLQNATDYKVVLNVIKPKSNNYKTLEATLLNKDEALFHIDLPAEFKDQVGDYIFEFEVSSKVENVDESITTSSSTYTVNKSILTGLNEEIESSPDLPVLKELINQVENFATKDEVNKKTEILPIEEICYILQDAIPVESGTNEFDETIYLFNEGLNYDDLLDKDLFCDITFNDGNNDITKQVKMELSYSRFCGEKDNYFFEFSNSYINSNGDAIDKTYFAVYDEDYTNCFEVKKVTLYYNSVSNLFQDKYIKSVDFSKIDNLDWRLNYITKRRHHTLTTDEYSKLKYPLNLKNVNVNETLPNETCTATEDNHVLSGMSGLSLYVNNSESEGFKGIKIEDYNLNKYIIQAYMSDYTDVKVKIIKHIIWNSGDEEYEVAYTNYDETGITERDIYFVDNGGYSCKKYDLYILFAKDDEEYSASVSLSIYKDDFLSTDELVPKGGTAGQVLTKISGMDGHYGWTTIPQLAFNNGELVVTINGVSKTFVAKE